jgi:hypothetical protein
MTVPSPSGVTGNGGVVELGAERLMRLSHRVEKSVEGKFGRVKNMNLRLECRNHSQRKMAKPTVADTLWPKGHETRNLVIVAAREKRE